MANFIGCICFFSFCYKIAAESDLLAIYSRDSKIFVRNVKSGEVIKTFTIQVDKPKNIIVDYKSDLIYFNDDHNVYRIHLLDEYGNRKVSGNGELVTNSSVDHSELLYDSFYASSTKITIKGNVLDETTKLLYTFYKQYSKITFYSYNYVKIRDTNDVKSSERYQLYMTFDRIIILKDMLYVTQPKSYGSPALRIDAIKLADIHKSTAWRQLGELNTPWVSIDTQTKRLFFIIVNNIIAVLNGDVLTTPILEKDIRHVITNSEVTKSVGEVVAFGKYVVWRSDAWNKLYVGKLKENMVYISKRDVRVLDESGGSNVLLLLRDDSGVKESEERISLVEKKTDDKDVEELPFLPPFH